MCLWTCIIIVQRADTCRDVCKPVNCVIGDSWTTSRDSERVDYHTEAADSDGLLSNTLSKTHQWLLVLRQQDWRRVNIDVIWGQSPSPSADASHDVRCLESVDGRSGKPQKFGDNEASVPWRNTQPRSTMSSRRPTAVHTYYVMECDQPEPVCNSR